MGLDVTGYKNIRKVSDGEETYFSSESWEQSNMPEIQGKINCEWDEGYDFRAGSYGGYNHFRNYLCKTINDISADDMWELAENNRGVAEKMPFYWLINFTDCDGYIGTSFCEIIYNDFVNNEEKFIEKTEGERYLKIYSDFKKVFELGKNNGLVDFH